MARDEAYRKAEERIAEALRTGADDLDLSSMGLTELPESLGQLTQLKTLRLYRNQLTELPESLGRLTELIDLELDGNRLDSLPESMCDLGKLGTLWLGGSTIGNPLIVLPESLRRLTRLRVLGAASCQLTVIPEWIGEFAELDTLHIAGNKLKALPKSLGQLTIELRADEQDADLEIYWDCRSCRGRVISAARSCRRGCGVTSCWWRGGGGSGGVVRVRTATGGCHKSKGH